MRRLVQIIPRDGVNLYGLMVKKEIDLAKMNMGTFRRAKAKERGRAKWSHAKRNGWINLQRGPGGIVLAEVLTKTDDAWALLQSFRGFVDRHFREVVLAVSVQHPD